MCHGEAEVDGEEPVEVSFVSGVGGNPVAEYSQPTRAEEMPPHTSTNVSRKSSAQLAELPGRFRACQVLLFAQINRNFVLDLENGSIVHPSRPFGIIPYSAAQGLPSGLCALLRLFARGLSNVRQKPNRA